jgi:hypothetical protein
VKINFISEQNEPDATRWSQLTMKPFIFKKLFIQHIRWFFCCAEKIGKVS